MKSGTNERIHTQGGVNVEFKIRDHVYIDYVGPGFDARELCLGKAVHESWNIPWEEVQRERLSRDGLRSFCVEVNIIEDGTLVPMEIEVPDRFKNKDRDVREI